MKLAKREKLLLAALLGLILLAFVYYAFLRERVRCSKLSGFHSYAWGGGSEICRERGCRVIRGRTVDDPEIFDDEGYEFACVPIK